MRRISLYIHAPFCKRRCSYCTFYHVPHDGELEEALVGGLVREINEVIREVSFVAPTAFFGGGTPSVLSRSSLDKIFDAIAPLLPAEETAEVTVEVNPEDVTADALDYLVDRGVNRISVGVQSMSPSSQRSLKRCAPSRNQLALELVADRFENFSVDVLLGIPGGSVRETEATMDAVGKYRPPHYSVYCLEPGGVLNTGVEDFFQRVDQERSADEYLAVCDRLSADSYVHYEVSNFARAGFESRHNRLYWGGGEYFGLGPAAHSRVNGRRFYNDPSIHSYVHRSGTVAESVRREEVLSPSQTLLEELMLSLRTADGVPIGRFGGAVGIVRDLVEHGLATIAEDRLVATSRGYLLLNEIVLRLAPHVGA